MSKLPEGWAEMSLSERLSRESALYEAYGDYAGAYADEAAALEAEVMELTMRLVEVQMYESTEAKEHELASLKHRLSEAVSHWHHERDLREDLEAKVADLEQRLHEQATARREARERVAELETELATTEKEVAGLQKHNAELEAQLADYEQHRKSLCGQLDTQRLYVTSLEAALAAIKGEP